MAPTLLRSPAIIALFAQVIGALMGLLSWRLLVTETDMALWYAVAVTGIVAAGLGKFLFRLPNWWLPINALFAPAIAGAMAAQLPGWFYLAAFLLTLAVFWNVRSDRVPLYLTNRKTWAAIHQLLPEKRDLRFVDLGSGIGGTTRYLATYRPDAQFVGVETAPLPLLVCHLRQLLNRLPNMEQRTQDLWSVDLAAFDVAYCFLSPQPMAQLYEKASTEMKPGSMLISNSFEVPGHPPTEEVIVDDSRSTRLLIWRF